MKIHTEQSPPGSPATPPAGPRIVKRSFVGLQTAWLTGLLFAFGGFQLDAQSPAMRIYDNSLRLLDNPQPLLADHPEFVQPIVELRRFEAPMLVADEGGDLDVRAWRYSYNARGIIEMPNRLRTTRLS